MRLMIDSDIFLDVPDNNSHSHVISGRACYPVKYRDRPALVYGFRL